MVTETSWNRCRCFFTLSLVFKSVCVAYYGYSVFTSSFKESEISWDETTDKLSQGTVATEIICLLTATICTIFGALIMWRMWYEWLFYHFLLVLLNIIVTGVSLMIYPTTGHYLNLASSIINTLITIIFIRLAKKVAESIEYYQTPQAWREEKYSCLIHAIALRPCVWSFRWLLTFLCKVKNWAPTITSATSCGPVEVTVNNIAWSNAPEYRRRQHTSKN